MTWDAVEWDCVDLHEPAPRHTHRVTAASMDEAATAFALDHRARTGDVLAHVAVRQVGSWKAHVVEVVYKPQPHFVSAGCTASFEGSEATDLMLGEQS